MIITLFFVALIISGIVVFVIDEWNSYTPFACVTGGIGLLVCSILIMCAHVGVDNQLEVNRIQREGIERRYDVLQSQCEDMSDISVLQDITEWNMDATRYRYWCNNPMTSWFYSEKIAQSLEPIDK